MAQIRFDQPEEPSTALVPAGEKQIVAYTEEEADRSDLITPSLNVVAKVGDLSNLFDAGSLVLDKTTLLVKKENALSVIAVSITKSYQEDTVFGEDMGDRAGSLAEVRAKGGQIEDREGEHFWISVAKIIFLIKKTENISAEADPLFFHQIGEDSYLLAQYYARKSAYSSVAKPLFTLKAMQGGPSKLVYNLSVALRSYNGNTWFGPNLRPAGRPSAEVAAYIASLNI